MAENVAVFPVQAALITNFFHLIQNAVVRVRHRHLEFLDLTHIAVNCLLYTSPQLAQEIAAKRGGTGVIEYALEDDSITDLPVSYTHLDQRKSRGGAEHDCKRGYICRQRWIFGQRAT